MPAQAASLYEIEHILGTDDIDKWIGKKIVVYAERKMIHGVERWPIKVRKYDGEEQ